MKKIIDAAIDAGTFRTFVAAVKKAGLANMLNEKGPFTVFAPDDQAFNKISKREFLELLANKEKLAEILKYHIVLGKIMGVDIIKIDSVRTLQGLKINVDATFDRVLINESQIIKKDIDCFNGVIHIINNVLTPV